MSVMIVYATLWIAMGILLAGTDDVWGYDGVGDPGACLFVTVVYILIWPFILSYKLGKVIRWISHLLRR